MFSRQTNDNVIQVEHEITQKTLERGKGEPDKKYEKFIRKIDGLLEEQLEKTEKETQHVRQRLSVNRDSHQQIIAECTSEFMQQLKNTLKDRLGDIKYDNTQSKIMDKTMKVMNKTKRKNIELSDFNQKNYCNLLRQIERQQREVKDQIKLLNSLRKVRKKKQDEIRRLEHGHTEEA